MSQQLFDRAPERDKVDIAIIGAGISGLYCAYRLINSKQFSDKKIAIYERLNRTGGRLQSDLIPIKKNTAVGKGKKANSFHDLIEIDTIKEEQGGMRFNYGMQELMRLNKKLGLCDQIVPFPMSSPGDTNRFCLRGHSFSLAEANASGNMIWSELYDLDPQEIGLSPVDLVTNAYRRIVESNHHLVEEEQTPEYWETFRNTFTWNKTPLNKWQMWGLLLDMGYSAECVEMLSETIGFAGPFKAMINAGDAWQILADFPKDPTYYTFAEGFSTLPNKIVEALKGKVDIYLSTNVEAISGKKGKFQLILTEAAEGQNSRPNIPRGKTKEVKAAQVISAIATTGFQALFTKSPALYEKHKGHEPARLWESISAAVGMKLMKINFYFKEAWWRNNSTSRPDIAFGPNFSDLPINAIYPFYSVNDLDVNHQAGTVAIKDPNDPAALTLYCDFNKTNFWAGLQNVGKKFSSPLQEKYNTKEAQTIFPASEAVVAEARKQMGLLFGITNVPEPVMTSFRNWNGEDDFEHAYHQWSLNTNDVEVMDYLASPLPGFYACNEAISDMQGWVNGSLRSANRALDAISNGKIKPMKEPGCKSAKKSVKANKMVMSKGHWAG